MGATDEQPGTGARPAADAAASGGLAVVAGYGIPGRAVADALAKRGMAVCVVEMNAETVRRLVAAPHPGITVMAGDASDEATLRRSGIERAAVFVAAVPTDATVLEAVRVARRLNPAVHILARCRHISSAMEATRRGADEVVSEEQIVAQEMAKRVAGGGG